MLNYWANFWMRFAGLGTSGRFAMKLAALSIPPYKARIPLAKKKQCGFIESTAILQHPDLRLGKNCFVGDRVVFFEKRSGGKIEVGDCVEIYRDSVFETGDGGEITIGAGSSIHPCCHIYSFLKPIIIGKGVMIAPNCALYSYNHSCEKNTDIRKQGIISDGPIIIEDEAWLGVTVTVLDGVTIGRGAVIAAGSVVTRDIPEYAVAAGVPAKVLRMRE
ncbi:MAG: acyltransferase [Desulforhopalus sp.]